MQGIEVNKGTARPPKSPKSWYKGSQLTTRSFSLIPMVVAKDWTWFRIARWERRTPFGDPLLPLLNCR